MHQAAHRERVQWADPRRRSPMPGLAEGGGARRRARTRTRPVMPWERQASRIASVVSGLKAACSSSVTEKSKPGVPRISAGCVEGILKKLQIIWSCRAIRARNPDRIRRLLPVRPRVAQHEHHPAIPADLVFLPAAFVRMVKPYHAARLSLWAGRPRAAAQGAGNRDFHRLERARLQG